MMTVIAVFAMVFAAGAVLLESSQEADGANSYIRGDTTVVKTGGEIVMDIMFFETEEFETLEITYTAVLKNSNGDNQSSAVTPTAGSLANGVDTALTIKAPTTAGKYTLVVSFTETVDNGEKVTTEKSQVITVTQPVKLTAVLKNNSNVSFTNFEVFFNVDGNRVEGSRTLVTVASGETATVSFDWAVESLSNTRHTFQVVAGDENIGDYMEVILGGDGEFYVGHTDYSLVNILFGLFLVVLIIGIIYLYRKPVKNYGKPKSRR